MSLHGEFVLPSRARGRLFEDDEQRDSDERCDHQQLVVVDVGNDLRLPSDDGIEYVYFPTPYPLLR